MRNQGRHARRQERAELLERIEEHNAAMSTREEPELDDIAYSINLLTRAVCNAGETIEAAAHRREYIESRKP
jgi:hypothetical protein